MHKLQRLAHRSLLLGSKGPLVSLEPASLPAHGVKPYALPRRSLFLSSVNSTLCQQYAFFRPYPDTNGSIASNPCARAFAKKYQGYKVTRERYYVALRALNCDSSFSLERCHDQFTRLAKIYHPDAPNGDQNKFIQIRQAYEEVEMYLTENDPGRMQREREELEQREKERQAQYWRDHPEEYQQHLKREREHEAARQENLRRQEELRAQKQREEEERRKAYERYREEQRKREEKYKIKVEVDDEARERIDQRAKEELLKKKKLQQEEQERLAREQIDRSSTLEQARRDAARRQKLAE